MAETNVVVPPSSASPLSAGNGMVRGREEAPKPTNLYTKGTSSVRIVLQHGFASGHRIEEFTVVTIEDNHSRVERLNISFGPTVVVVGDSNTITSGSFNNEGNGNQDLSSADINSAVSGTMISPSLAAYARSLALSVARHTRGLPRSLARYASALARSPTHSLTMLALLPCLLTLWVQSSSLSPCVQSRRLIPGQGKQC